MKELQILLANLWVVFFNLRNAHWNIKALNFLELHKLFGELYSMVEGNADDVAERIRQLDGTPAASMPEYMALANIKSAKTLSDATEAISINIAGLYALNTQIINIMAGLEAKDEATRNLLAAICQEYEKQLWILQSFKA